MLSVSFNNNVYEVPEESELNWSSLTYYLADLALYLTNGYLANSQASIKLSPITTSGTINDLATSNKSLFDLSQASKLTGLANPSQGRFVTILNTSSNVLEITHNDTSSTDTNRIVTDDNQSYFLNPSNFITLYYDQNVNRWRVIRESVLDKSVIKSVSTVGAINDYEVNNNTILLFSGATTLSGFVARPGRQLILVNNTGSAITIKDQATSSTANQIITGKSGDITLDNNTSISLIYDSITAKWRVVGSSISRSEITSLISNIEFKDLLDVPSSYASQKGKVVKVKTDESGLEFGNSTESNNYILYSTCIDTPSSIGYNTYADSASSSPVDGTGGTANITFTRNTSSPISSDADFRLTKTAVNRQGEGVSYDFTIDKRHNAKVLQITVDASLISGTYSTGDLKLFIMDKTSGEVIQPVNYSVELPVSGLSAKLIATFQSHVTNVSYRLCIHVSSTSASAYTVAFNNFKIWEPEKNYGAIITDWQDYSMTIGGSTSAPTKGTTSLDKAQWRRNGGNMEIRYDYIQTAIGSSANGSGTYLFPLPSGYSIDTAKISSLSYNGISTGAVGQAHVTGGSINKGSVNVYNATNLSIALGNETNTFQNMGSSFQNMSQATLSITINASVPISGWGSSVATSSDSGDSREVSSIATGTPTGGSGTDSIIIFGTSSRDSHGAYNSTTGRYTIPVAGRYAINGYVNASNSSIAIQLFKNASLVYRLGITGSSGQCNYSGFVDCLVGDVIDIRSSADMGTKGANGFLSIYRIGSSSQLIAPVETVACSYYSASTQTSLTTQINFGTKIYDTHNAVTTGSSWKFTAPMAGKYLVTGFIATAVSESIFIYKNAVLQNIVTYTANDGNQKASLTTTVDLLAGDYIDFRPGATEDVYGSPTSSSANRSQIQISRLGI